MRDFICRFLLISSFIYLCISTLYLPTQEINIVDYQTDRC